MQNGELYLAKLIGFMPKAFGAIVGAVLSLVLSGDIDRDGKLQLNKTVLLKMVVSASAGAYIGQLIIEHFDFDERYSVMAQGAIMMAASVFSLLIIGIIYQSLAMSQGKPLPEVIKDIKEAFTAIFK